jgi:uncharacterized protein (TIGR03435 family)
MHRFLAIAAILLGRAFAQPAFEVASIKPQALTVGKPGFVGIQTSGNTLHAEAQALAGLVTYAYGIEDFQVSGGPSWIYSRDLYGSDTYYSRDLYGSDTYEVVAKAGGEAAPSTDQFKQMLQALLADRFQLKIHLESKEMPAYELVVGKNGHKLKDATADPDAHTNWRSGPAAQHYSGKKVSMADLVFLLRTQSGRPVIDKTGLTGKYDFELEWASGDPPPPEATAPSIFTAVQEQLGLKLESVKAPFSIVVIDQAERPSAN